MQYAIICIIDLWGDGRPCKRQQQSLLLSLSQPLAFNARHFLFLSFYMIIRPVLSRAVSSSHCQCPVICAQHGRVGYRGLRWSRGFDTSVSLWRVFEPTNHWTIAPRGIQLWYL